MADVVIQFGAELAGISAGVNAVKSLLEGLQGTVAEVSDNFRELGDLVGVSLTFEGLKAFVEGMSELGEQTERTAEIFGITTEQVGLLNFAAEQTGGSGEALIRTLETLTLRLEEAGGKASPAAAAIRALGLDARSLASGNILDVLDTMRQRFSALPDGVEKAAISMALARNGAEQLLPVLNLSNAAWAQLKQTFETTGASMSAATAAAFANTAHDLNTLKTSFTGVGETIFGSFEPAIDTVVEGLTKLVQGINDELHHSDLLSLAFGAIVFAVDAVVASVLTLVAAFEVLYEVASGVIISINNGLIGLAKGVVDAVGGNFKKAGQDLADTWKQLGSDVTDTGGKIGGVLNSYTELVEKLYGIGGKSPPAEITVGGHGGGGGGLNFDNSGVQAAMASEEQYVAAWKTGIAATERGLQTLVAMHKITAQQGVAFEKEAIDQQLADTLAAYQKELSIAGLTAAQRQQIENKITAAKQEAAAKREQIDEQEAEREYNLWDQGFNNFFSMINQATQQASSFGDAFRIVVDDMVKNFIEGLEKMLAEWIAKTGLMQSLGFIGNVIGLALGIPSFDVGAWNLSNDMVAQVHKGEMIIPAQAAGALRSAMTGAGASGGGAARSAGGSSSDGGDTHIHIHTIDAAGVKQFIAQNAGALTDAVGNHLRKNHTARSAWKFA